MIDLLKSSALEGIKIGDPLVFGSKGVFRVDNVERINTGIGDQDCLVLSHLFNKTITKTFLPVGQVPTSGLRKLQNPKTWPKFVKTIDSLELKPEEFKTNSNAKMAIYEKRILRGDLTDIINVYLCVNLDMASTGIADKRYVAFKERLLEVTAQELSLIQNQSFKEAFDEISLALKIQTSH